MHAHLTRQKGALTKRMLCRCPATLPTHRHPAPAAEKVALSVDRDASEAIRRGIYSEEFSWEMRTHRVCAKNQCSCTHFATIAKVPFLSGLQVSEVTVSATSESVHEHSFSCSDSPVQIPTHTYTPSRSNTDGSNATMPTERPFTRLPSRHDQPLCLKAAARTVEF